MASIPVGSIANWAAVPTCTTNCPATLGEAKAQGSSGLARRLAQLLGVDADGSLGNLGNLILNDILLGILPRSSLNWSSSLDGLQLFGGTGENAHYHVRVNVRATGRPASTINVLLPKGFIVKPQTSFVTYGIGDRRAAPNPTTNATTGARWASFGAWPCAGLSSGSQTVQLDFEALIGYQLNTQTAVATAGFGGTTPQDNAQIVVTQNWERNEDPATAPVVGPGRPAGCPHRHGFGDKEVFRLPIPSVPGTRTTVYLSHIPQGADYDLVINQPGAPSPISSPVGSIPVGSIPIEDEGSWSTTPARSRPRRCRTSPSARSWSGASRRRGERHRGRHGRLRRSERLLHDPGPRLQRLAQRGARRPARRADAAADAAPVSGQDLPEQGRPQRTLPARCPPRRRPSSSTTEPADRPLRPDGDRCDARAAGRAHHVPGGAPD